MSQTNVIQNITGGWNVSDIRISNLSESINMFIETQGVGSSTTSVLRSINGSTELVSIPEIDNKPCRGIFECSRDVDGKPILFAVFSDKLYVIKNYSGTYTPILISQGVLNNLDTPVSMCETGGEGSSNPHLIVVDGSNVLAVATNLQISDMIEDVRLLALPYRIRQDDEENPTERIQPTHCAYCYNYLIVNDNGTDAFYITYQYPFERTYTEESGASSFVTSINNSIAKISDNAGIYKVSQNMSKQELLAMESTVNDDPNLTESEKTQINKLIDDYISYELWDLSLPGEVGTIDYDVFMTTPWRATEVGYKDYGFITYSEWSPDNTTALCSNGTLLYTFGPKSSQIFTYNSDVEAPFVSPTNSANGIGIKAVHSLAMVGDYVFYLGSSSIGENGIYRWQSNQLTKISTPDIERKVSSLPNNTDAIGQCWTENGHMFYALTFVNGDYTLVYDITENLWHRRSSKDRYSNLHHKWRLGFATLYESKLIFGTNDGKLVYLDPNKYVEYDGRPMIRMRRSGMLYNNYQDFIVDGIKLICNTGDFDNPNLVPQIMMRYSDNGGYWSNQEIGLLGKQGNYGHEVEWFNLGIHNILSVEFSCSDPVNFAILSGKIQYSLVDSF